MEKLRNINIKNKYINDYKTDKDFSIKDFLYSLKNSNLEFQTVTIDEGVEMDMQTISATFNIDDLLQNIDILKTSPEYCETLSLVISCEFNSLPLLIRIHPGNEFSMVSLMSEGTEVDIDDILKKRN